MRQTIFLTNPQVNSGESINLLATNINYSGEIFTSVQDKPRDSVTEEINDYISPGYHTGLGNPTFSIIGIYNLDTSHGSGAGALIDTEFIEDLVLRADQECTLKAQLFETTSNSAGEKTVMLIDYTVDNPLSDTVEYTFTFREVRNS